MTKWTVWTEGWTVTITHNSTASFASLKSTFRSQGQSQFIPYFDAMTRPQGHGHWTMSTNHLDPKSPAPQLWCTWDSEFTIQDIIALQDFKLAKGVTTYPVTLLWYPKMQDPDAFSVASDPWPYADETLLPGRGSSPMPAEQFMLPEDPLDLAPTARAPSPAAPTKTQAKGKAKALHKRQISEAIPGAEREVARAPVAETAEAGTRKSARPRKPKSRN
jgi:hypothetical protein